MYTQASSIVGTFEYNGGPLSPVPMPTPTRDAQPIDNGIQFVSTQISGGTSPYTVVAPAKTSPRISYPAYGEEPIVPAPRKR
jgi:hypothetical protein